MKDKMKTIKSFSIHKEDWDKFITITSALNISASELLTEYIKNFNISHKAEFNDAIKNYWEK